MNAEKIRICYHCGENITEETIITDDHEFCCSGCKTVYEILREGDLCEYYELNKNPGGPLRKNNSVHYEFLDTPEAQIPFTRFRDNEQVHVQFTIPAMHCSSCIWLLENLHKLDSRIIRSRVNFITKELYLVIQTELTLSELASLLDKIGYAPSLSMNDLEPGKKKSSYFDKTYFYKLGIAFFCFGNIMLLSFPEYFGIGIGADSHYRKLFGYLNFTLALPVMFYSASEFFRSAWNGLRFKKLNMDFPIALGLIVIFLQGSAEIFMQSGGGYMDTLASLVFLMLIGRALQNYTNGKISFDRDYRSYFPVSVTVQENGNWKNIPATKIVPGQRILIRNGELIPADAILFRGDGQIDYSFVTGESAPVTVTLGELIYAGGRQCGAAIEAEIIREVSQSYLTRLWNENGETDQRQKLESLSNRISGYFTLVILIIATAAAMYWINTDLNRSLHAFVSVLIITCPCALALSTPFTLGNASRFFGRHRFYLKNSGVVEKLASIDTFIFDKTGTITEPGKAKVSYIGENLSEEEKIMVRSLAGNSTHPFSRIIYNQFSSMVISPENFREHPGKGIEGVFNNVTIQLGSEKWIFSKDDSEPEQNSKVWISVSNKPKGFFLIGNEYRSELKTVVNQLKRDHRISVLSGDHEGEWKNLTTIFGGETDILFNQSPFDKMSYIRTLQNSGKRSAMIGDGLNDAGALRASDCGIAISEDLNNFSPGCDAILDAHSFHLIPKFIRLAKAAKKIIIASFVLSFLYNMVGIYFAVQGELSPLIAAILMPLSSVTIILFTTTAVYLTATEIFSSENSTEEN
jgi:P-type Cu+ transporter